MQIDVCLPNRGTATRTRGAIERRIRTVLGRFSDRILRAEVVLVDVNGPRGGTDQLCTVILRSGRLTPIVIKDAHERAMTAVDRALARAVRHIRDKFNRRRDVRRHTRTDGPTETRA